MNCSNELAAALAVGLFASMISACSVRDPSTAGHDSAKVEGETGDDDGAPTTTATTADWLGTFTSQTGTFQCVAGGAGQTTIVPAGTSIVGNAAFGVLTADLVADDPNDFISNVTRGAQQCHLPFNLTGDGRTAVSTDGDCRWHDDDSDGKGTAADFALTGFTETLTLSADGNAIDSVIDGASLSITTATGTVSCIWSHNLHTVRDTSSGGDDDGS